MKKKRTNELLNLAVQVIEENWSTWKKDRQTNGQAGVQTDRLRGSEWRGANELSGWSQDNRNYNSFPCFSLLTHFMATETGLWWFWREKKKKQVIIILLNGSTRFGTLLFGCWMNENWKSISFVCRSFSPYFSIGARLFLFSKCIMKHTVAMQ